MTEIVVVLTTVADNDDAETLARQLVEERLAACANLHPAMVSFHRWKGQLEREAERQMVIKTTRDRVPALEQRLTQLHSYDLPEFVVLPVDSAGAAYAAWIAEQLVG